MSVSETHPDASVYRRARRISIIEGMLQALMVGFSESYLGALAVELGHGATALGLLATVPLLLGALSQLAVGPLSGLFGSPKRLVVWGAVLQAATHAGLVWIAWTENRHLAPLLVTKSLFWVAGSVMTPAWGAWMATLTENVSRERYFGLRSGLGQFALLLSFAGAGRILRLGQVRGETLRAYALIIGLALLARAASAVAFALQADPARTHLPLGALRRIRTALRTAHWRVALYLAALMFGAHVSVPFFTPYMLRTLRLDYGQFALLTAVSILTKALVFPQCYRLSERVGLRTTLGFSGVAVSLTPAAWALAPDIDYLYGAQALSGVAWAGLEFASFQLLIQSAGGECRTEFLSLANALSGGAQLVGALVGGCLLDALALPYVEIFWISAGLRAGALVLLVISVRALEFPKRLPRFFGRLRSVRPTTGGVREPVIPRDSDEAA